MPDSSILLENADIKSLSKGNLTTDCYVVVREDGQVDLARGAMVSIFDLYHDKGVEIVRISHAGGTLNPKLHSPKIDA